MDISDDTISSATLRRARAGEQDAWNSLVSRYAPKVYRWCRQSSVAEQDAIDVTQDVLTQLYQSLPTLTRDLQSGDSLSAWLFTVTRNKARDHFRRQSREPVAHGASEDYPVKSAAAPESTSSQDLKLKILRLHRLLAAVESDVDHTTWQAFWRLTVDGDPAKTIAAELQISEGAVRQAKYRVLQKLREEGI